MKVFKFGGASVNGVDKIKNVKQVLESYKNGKLVIIISAMGKTTNALEKVAEAFFENKKEEALLLFQAIKENHLTIAKYLLVTTYNKTSEALHNFFTEVEWMLHDKPVRDYDYYYDQIVCVGELLSTSIVSAYLNECGMTNTWLDVRDIIRTDDNFRDAIVDWKITKENLSKSPMANESGIYLTQGFVGATDENESTTLGREGSDYSAAIFANLLDAESLTIWKDVEGVMSADPKEFPDATFIPQLTYREVIEMAYYGAQVIHPKTIKPLQNKKIPLHVKSFVDPSLPGTTIFNIPVKDIPPIIVLKANQVILHMQSKDFSFVGEKPMTFLYDRFHELNIKPTLIQTGAINVQVCIDNRPDKVEQLALRASEIFDVQIETDLTLLTIRHFTNDLLQEMTRNHKIILMQKTPETVQVLMAENKSMD